MCVVDHVGPESAPAEWSCADDFRHSRPWAVSSRWAGDGVSLAGAAGGWSMVRRIDGGRGYSRMNLVEVVSGSYRDVPQEPGVVERARAVHADQLVVATTGYGTRVNEDTTIASPARWADYLSKVRDLAGAEGRTPGIAHVPEQWYAHLRHACEALGWHVGLTDVTAEIGLGQGGLPAYLDRLSSKARRNYRRETNAVAKNDGTLTVIGPEDLERVVGPIAALQAEAQRRRGEIAADVDVRTAELERFLRWFGEQAVGFTVIDSSGDLVAATVCVATETHLLPYFLGLDQERSARLFGYFNVAYYAPIQYACDHGIERVLLGPGTLGPKLARGAHLIPLYSAVPGDRPDLTNLLATTDAMLRTRWTLESVRC